jgi:hypothetical protein
MPVLISEKGMVNPVCFQIFQIRANRIPVDTKPRTAQIRLPA